MTRKDESFNGEGEDFEKVINIGNYFGEMALVTNDEVRNRAVHDWKPLRL